MTHVHPSSREWRVGDRVVQALWTAILQDERRFAVHSPADRVHLRCCAEALSRHYPDAWLRRERTVVERDAHSAASLQRL
jgi:hypothetical protein